MLACWMVTRSRTGCPLLAAYSSLLIHHVLCMLLVFVALTVHVQQNSPKPSKGLHLKKTTALLHIQLHLQRATPGCHIHAPSTDIPCLFPLELKGSCARPVPMLSYPTTTAQCITRSNGRSRGTSELLGCLPGANTPPGGGEEATGSCG